MNKKTQFHNWLIVRHHPVDGSAILDVCQEHYNAIDLLAGWEGAESDYDATYELKPNTRGRLARLSFGGWKHDADLVKIHIFD